MSSISLLHARGVDITREEELAIPVNEIPKLIYGTLYNLNQRVIDNNNIVLEDIVDIELKSVIDNDSTVVYYILINLKNNNSTSNIRGVTKKRKQKNNTFVNIVIPQYITITKFVDMSIKKEINRIQEEVQQLRINYVKLSNERLNHPRGSEAFKQLTTQMDKIYIKLRKLEEELSLKRRKLNKMLKLVIFTNKYGFQLSVKLISNNITNDNMTHYINDINDVINNLPQLIENNVIKLTNDTLLFGIRIINQSMINLILPHYEYNSSSITNDNSYNDGEWYEIIDIIHSKYPRIIKMMSKNKLNTLLCVYDKRNNRILYYYRLDKFLKDFSKLNATTEYISEKKEGGEMLK